MSSRSDANENSENTCVVCFKSVDIYSVGECDHPVCYECSTRMRVLCRQNECPICRKDLSKVIFTHAVRPFHRFDVRDYPTDRKFKICFEDEGIQKIYNKLLEHSCAKCHSRPAFRTFNSLKDHMRKEHELFYCDLCVEHLKIFSHERRCYTRSELAMHRRKGDADNRSHRGHPLCKFCDLRYMDNDELFRHLRQQHYFCHFCDADGLHQFYAGYDALRHHFRQEHYLCEDGDCQEEKFTSVFRSEIDLKAHRASVHCRTLSKAAAKQARTLELEFTLAPRSREREDMGGGRAMRGGRRPGPKFREREIEEETPTSILDGNFVMSPSINMNCTQEFPSLGLENENRMVNGESSRSGSSQQQRNTLAQKLAVNNGFTIRTFRPASKSLAMSEDEFPALGGTRVTVTTPTSPHSPPVESRRNTVHLSLNGQETSHPNLSIQVNQSFSVPSSSASSSLHHVTRLSSTFRPENGKSKTTSWLSNSTNESRKKTPVDDFPSLCEAFNAGCSTNVTTPTKKASSVTIPVSQPSWSVARSEESDILSNSTSSIGNVKVKAKKKKSKGANQSLSDTSPVKEAKAAGEPSKRKKKPLVEETSSYHQTESRCRGENQENKKPSQKSETEQQRKRSELKIESLKNGDVDDANGDLDVSLMSNSDFPSLGNDFPSLGNDFPSLSNVASRPPGFSSVPTTIQKPPPGFNSSRPAPPGFFVKLNSVARSSPSSPPASGVTFTNSSGESFSLSPTQCGPSETKRTYHQPTDFTGRNQALVACVKGIVETSGGSLEDFRQVSAKFRGGVIAASEYHELCVKSMGETGFKSVFPELLALLPDIQKQQDLLTAHIKKYPMDINNFTVCATCQQVLTKSDLRHHVSSHALDNHFPVLDSQAAPSAWVRK